MNSLTVRGACRQRMPLDGTDAQALEHALTITERERDAARELSETWRRAHLAWQRWARDLLKHLGMQPDGGEHIDSAAREIIGMLALESPKKAKG